MREFLLNRSPENEWLAASWPFLLVVLVGIVWLCVLGLPPEVPKP
jgi:hypothetical protein